MKAIDQDQILGIISEMKEAVRRDRNIDSRDSLELLHCIRRLGRAVKKGEVEVPIIEKVVHACSREESLKAFPQQLVPFMPQVAPLVQNQG